jgi:MFS family permease
MKKKEVPSKRKTEKNRKNGFKNLLQNKTFRTLFFAESVSLIGDRILMIALIIMIYDRTQSVATVSILTIMRALPAFLFGGIAGALADRTNKKWIMVISNFAQGLLILLIPFFQNLFLIYGIYLLMSLINQFFIPARASIIPEIVKKEDLIPANSFFSMMFVGSIALGPAIGGIFIEQYGLNAAFYADACTFFIPACIVFFLPLPHKTSDHKNISLLEDVKRGLRYLKKDIQLRLAFLLSAASYLGIGTINILGIMLAEEILHVGKSGYGTMMSAMGVGLFMGALFMGRWGRAYKKIHVGIVGSFISGIAMIILPHITSFLMVLPALMTIGFGTVLVQTSCTTLVQLTPKEIRGKFVGISLSLMGASSFLAMGLAGILTEYIGIYWVLAIVGSIGIAVGSIGKRVEKVLKKKD